MPRFLFAALLALGLLSAPAPLFAQEQEKTQARAESYDWVLFYWMAYDNNLAKCAAPILKMLRQGLVSEKVAVVVFADLPGAGGMQRYVLTKENTTKGDLETEASADATVVAEQLAWTGKNLPAKKYGLVFLNHGGALGQMSIDEHPANGQKHRWMFPPNLAKVCTSWRKEVPGEVELFFFQQCGKGSLENYHVMKDAARYVLGSQTVVGAPNAYYAKTLRWLGEHPEADGLALAKKITETEIPRMFTTYTTLDSKELGKLEEKLEPVLAPLLAKGKDLAFPAGKLRHCFDFGKREYFFDGIAFLDAVYAANGLDRAPFAAFKRWSEESLVVSHRVSPLEVEKAQTWCGYSLLMPLGERMLRPYAKHYPIYTNTKITTVFDQLHQDLVVKAAARRKAMAEKMKERRRKALEEGKKPAGAK